MATPWATFTPSPTPPPIPGMLVGKIAFLSNRTGKRQIWVMNTDGSNLHSLSRTGYDDWDPVWIKYTN